MNKPIETFPAGSVEVAVWENQTEDQKTFHTATLKRSYRDASGEWKEAGTVSLAPQNIPDVILALSKSYEFLRMGLRDRKKAETASHEQAELPAEPAPAGDFSGRVGRRSTKAR